MLTKKQLELFTYIEREVNKTGIAPSFDEMKEALAGVKYTSYEESVSYLPSASGDGKLKEVFDAFNEINVVLDLQDAPLKYRPYVDGAVLTGLFNGHTR